MATIKPKHSSKQRTWVYLFLGTIVTVVLLSWAFRDVSLIAVWDVLKSGRLEWLFIAWLGYFVSYWVRARRWGTLLGASSHPGRFKTRLAATFVGFGANSVLPAYAGELIRAGVLYRLDGLPMEAAAGSIFTERLFDLAVVFLFLLLPLWLGVLPVHPHLAGLPLGWTGAALLAAFIILLIAACFPSQIAKLAGIFSQTIGLGRFKSRIVSIVTNFLNGLLALRQPQRCLIVLAETAGIWILNGITYWAGLIAFNITPPGFLGALFTQSITALAIALPSTPGNIGPFEAGVRFTLNLYSIPVATTIAYALALRFLMYYTTLIIGLAIALKLGIRQSDILLKNTTSSSSKT